MSVYWTVVVVSLRQESKGAKSYAYIYNFVVPAGYAFYITLGLVYGILRVLIWSFAVVSRARRVFAKDYPQKYRRFNKEKAR